MNLTGQVCAACRFWQQRYDRLKKEGKDDQITASLDYFEDQGRRASGTVVYIKAALFFRATAKIGDRRSFALQSYYQGINTALQSQLICWTRSSCRQVVGGLLQRMALRPRKMIQGVFCC
jgi:hypothetical protein